LEATKSKDDLLTLAGIDDAATFYRERFSSGSVFHGAYFDPLSRFDITFARTMWVYDNVKRGSRVLDLGCGEGVLALLKRKDVELLGVDISPELLGLARRNGYDRVYVADLTALPFADHSFDYVVSLDVLGHISFTQKAAVLSEIKRVLKPEGATLHGIECLDRDRHQDYDAMSEEKLRQFVAIDGHIGLEDDDEHTDRFRALFKNVEARSRYTLCLSVAEFLKQADEYEVPFETDFVDYLRGLTFKERLAFDRAMGYVFAKISDLDVRLPKSGLYMLLKASDAPLDRFYNAHRDRRELFGGVAPQAADSDLVCLDRDSRAFFDSGWYAANYLPPVARWMGHRACVRFEAAAPAKLKLDLTTHMPDLKTKPLSLEFFVNGMKTAALSLIDYGWLELEVACDDGAATSVAGGVWELEIRADRTWQPSVSNGASTDDRELSIAVCNITIPTGKSRVS
jgi:ubiquinone/menaquinone biosynthesis C-methylase UbiE